MEYETFISSINELISQEKTSKQERLLQGECFNIFQIMGLASDEVHTHSSIIEELVNPNGMHGCGDVFLQLFLEQIPQLKELGFNTHTARSAVEYSVGEISTHYDEGGRIDILIEADNKAIVIENKIYAGDQPKQIYRYHKFAQGRYHSNFKLLYLTLDGKDPSQDSIHTLSDNDYICVSYKSDIKNWIEKCINQVANKPLIKATLLQYLNLINILTHQDMNNNISAQLSDLCTKPENIEAFVWMYEHYESIINRVMNERFVPQLEEVAKRNSLLFKIKKDSAKKNHQVDWINTRYMRFDFYKKTWDYFWLSFEFQSMNMKRCVWGFRYKEDDLRKQVPELKKSINDIIHGNMSDGWAVFNYMKPDDWISREIISEIYDNTLIDKIEDIIKGELPKVERFL